MPSNNRPPPITLTNEDNDSINPSLPRFTISDEADLPHHTAGHSQPPSNPQSDSLTPPVSPRSLTFSTSTNPFSPGTSVKSYAMDTPLGSPGINNSDGYFGESQAPSSVATSIIDGQQPRVTSSYSIYGNRPDTADYSMSSNSVRASRFREAFNSPPSRPVTIYSSPSSAKLIKERTKSTMIRSEAPLNKPWLDKKDPAGRLAYILTYGVMLIGFAVGALRIYFDWQAIPMMTGNLCPVLDEEFENGEEGVFGDNGKFFREVDMSGFGNGEFQMTTSSPNNSFVSNGKLYLRPTLTSDSIPMDAIMDGHVFNITDCTFNITRGASYTQSTKNTPIPFNTSAIGQNTFDAEGYYRACSAVSNSTAGKIINPVQSARLSTRRTANIRFGKVEVRAKIPTGDWLWPAIWMLPVDNTYGGWPLSGEIDIMEARGNGPTYVKEGTDHVRGSLNWGPTILLNAVAKTYGLWKLRRGTYDEGFHTYSLEWTEDFIRISVDTKLHKVLQRKMKKSFWEFGDFPPVVRNGTGDIVLTNPWKDGSNAAPFDQRFYLILSLGVGGTNGWFPDGGGDKPWLDGSQTAPRDFLRAQDQWLSTWPEDVEKRSFVIDSVKMWQQC